MNAFIKGGAWYACFIFAAGLAFIATEPAQAQNSRGLCNACLPVAPLSAGNQPSLLAIKPETAAGFSDAAPPAPMTAENFSRLVSTDKQINRDTQFLGDDTANAADMLPVANAHETGMLTKVALADPPAAPQYTQVITPAENPVAEPSASVLPPEVKAHPLPMAKPDAASVNNQKIASVPLTAAEQKKPAVDAVHNSEPSDLLGGSYLKSLNGNGGIIALEALPSAPPPNVVDPISLGEAVAFSLKNNYEVLAAKASVKESWYNKLGAYSAYGPSIQADLSQGSEYSAPASINDAYGNRVLRSEHPFAQNDVTVRQPVIDLSIIADILNAHSNESIAEEDERDTREQTAYDTANIYLQLIQSHIAIGLANQYETYLNNLAGRMAVRLEGGGATKADLERIKGRATFAESAKIEALGEYRSNLSEFARLTKIVPAKLQIPDILNPPVPPDIQVAFDHAIKGNPSYKSSLSKVDAAEGDRNKAFSTLAPKLSLQYAHSHTYDSAASAKGNAVDGLYPRQTTDSYLVVATWAINGGTSLAAGLAGVQKEEATQLKSYDIKDRMEQAIRTSYDAVNAANQRITVLQHAVKSNSLVVKDFEIQQNEGNRTLFDLLDAYEQLYNARLSLMRLVVAQAQASLQIRRQMGELAAAIVTIGEP